MTPRHPWLSYLFDCYALVDASVAQALAEAMKDSARREKHTGCAKGCDTCCRQAIPVTPLEAAGLRWYVREKMTEQTRAALMAQLGTTGSGGPGSPSPRCPFLLDGSCAAYPMRPVACRRYMVLGAPCAPGEDPTVTRPEQMLQPSRKAMNAAYAATLPYYTALGEQTPHPDESFAFMTARTVALQALGPDILKRPLIP